MAEEATQLTIKQVAGLTIRRDGSGAIEISANSQITEKDGKKSLVSNGDSLQSENDTIISIHDVRNAKPSMYDPVKKLETPLRPISSNLRAEGASTLLLDLQHHALEEIQTSKDLIKLLKNYGFSDDEAAEIKSKRDEDGKLKIKLPENERPTPSAVNDLWLENVSKGNNIKTSADFDALVAEGNPILAGNPQMVTAMAQVRKDMVLKELNATNSGLGADGKTDKVITSKEIESLTPDRLKKLVDSLNLNSDGELTENEVNASLKAARLTAEEGVLGVLIPPATGRDASRGGKGGRD